MQCEYHSIVYNSFLQHIQISNKHWDNRQYSGKFTCIFVYLNINTHYTYDIYVKIKFVLQFASYLDVRRCHRNFQSYKSTANFFPIYTLDWFCFSFFKQMRLHLPLLHIFSAARNSKLFHFQHCHYIFSFRQSF